MRTARRRRRRCAVCLRPAKTAHTLLTAPEPIGLGRVDQRALVAQRGVAVAGEQQRAVEIDPVGALREQHRRRHGRARSPPCSPTMILKPRARACVGERQRLGQAAGLVELDVDGIVAVGERGEVGAVVQRFVGAHRHGRAGRRAPHRRRPAAAARSARRRSRRPPPSARAAAPASRPRWRRRSGARRGRRRGPARRRSASPAPPSFSFRSGMVRAAAAALAAIASGVSRLMV